MTKQHLIFKLLFLLGISFFISCSNDANENFELTIDEQSLIIEEGVLKLPSEGQFLETLDYLKTLSYQELENWIKDLGFSNSQFLVQEYYNQLPTDKDISLQEKLNKASILYIPDPAFAALLNKKGMYKIGEEYHKITTHKEYISKDYSLISELESNSKIKANNNIIEFDLTPIIETNTQRTNLNGLKLCAKNLNNNYLGTEFYGNSYFNKFEPYPENNSNCSSGDYSFHTQTWYTPYSNHLSVGSWIKGRKYKKGGAFRRKKWRDDNMSYAKINNSSVTNKTIHTIYFNQDFSHGPVIPSFNINYEYNDEGKGLRKVSMILQSIQ